MLVLDNNLVSDYLDGKDEARAFLVDYEEEPWGVSAIVLYEALIGSVYGHIDGTPREVRQAITTSMDVLDVSERIATEAAILQQDLMDRGAPADHPDTLIAATAHVHGAVFATAEKHFWKDEVRDVLNVAKYDPY